ncbi:hypothetical protein SS05631_b64430 (plasmid) [Sinorhizobium sp. CCBAU 05631]|nr:hypothetical protein SS05631_b64430 [Sinorhizobium sp. CCBAU 05631]
MSAMASSREASNGNRYSLSGCRGELIFALSVRFAGRSTGSSELLLAAGT